MVRITLDIFSGRPNPSWVLDEAEAREVLRDLASDPGALAEAALDGHGRLGYRGVVVESESDREASALQMPRSFRVGGAGSPQRGLEVVERLVARGQAPQASPRALERAPGLSFDLAELEAIDFAALVREEVGRMQSEPGSQGRGGVEGHMPAATVIGSDATSWTTQTVGSCSVEVAAFNPGFWNAANVQPYNNCYNYASNRRTDTFAQPGRASGAQARRMRCDAVTAGALSDGALQAPNCAAAGQEPRWYMALVVWPGTDYHWYRLQDGGVWGHKPGQTAARNTDNSNVIITNPETANRGGYRDFCGYFFSNTGHGIQ